MFHFSKTSVGLAFIALLFSCNDNTVTDPYLGLVLLPTELSVTTGDTAQIFVEVTNNVAGQPIQWSSSNEQVIEIDSQGHVIATGGGSATITAAIGKSTGQCSVTVTPAVFISGWVNTSDGSIGKVWIGTKEYMSIGDSSSNTYINDVEYIGDEIICVGSTNDLESGKTGGASWSMDGMIVDFGAGYSVNAVAGGSDAGTAMAYYAGTTETEMPYSATIWSPSIKTMLSGSNGNSYGNDMAIQGSATTYVAGSAIDDMNYSQPAVWKDSQITFLSSSELGGEACKVAVSDTNTYVSGTVGDDAILWTNGVADTLLSNGNKAVADGICVDGSDIYVAGYITTDQGFQTPVYWLNGSIKMLAESEAGVAKDVVVVGDDVYVVGFMYDEMYQIATVWENGDATSLAPSGMTSGVSAITSH